MNLGVELMGLYDLPERVIRERIGRKKVGVCVVGLGTVGLPVAVMFAERGYRVAGVDVDAEKVEKVNRGEYVFEYRVQLSRLIKAGRFKATTSWDHAVETSEIIILCVPTPLTNRNEADLSYLRDAIKEIASRMTKGTMIIVESSVPIGTTRKLGKEIERIARMTCGHDFGLAYTPERYDPITRRTPGPKSRVDLSKLPRVVAGINAKSSNVAKKLYSQVVKADVIEAASLETAEAAKLLENVFRDVNIALVNELSSFFSKLGLNTFEVINVAATKPYGFIPHYPGPGVGGTCIPVVPWFLIRQAEELGSQLKLTRTAREVNDSMPPKVVELIEKALEDSNVRLDESKVLVLGLAYKGNINDPRGSPSELIINLLNARNAKVEGFDPLVKESDETDLMKVAERADVLVFATDHQAFSHLPLRDLRTKMRNPIIVDCRNQLKRELATSLGFRYYGLGKAASQAHPHNEP